MEDFFSIFEIKTNFWTFWKVEKLRWLSYLVYFQNFGLQKTLLHKCLKSPVVEDPSKAKGKRSQTLCSNLNFSTFTKFIDQCERKLSREISVSVIRKILILFVNSLTADGKDSLVDRDNFTQPVWMYLSKKPKNFP